MRQAKKTIEIDRILPLWWKRQPQIAKISFFSALVMGFFSHLFVYAGRYYGDHDMGMVLRSAPYAAKGRWLNTIINQLSFGYVVPYTSGIFVSLFLAISAFYICKLFAVQNKMNAFLIGTLLATFPTISVTNLFIYDSPNYHFGVLLAVIAVYITVKYKFGFLISTFLLMCALAIYQANINVAAALCLLILINKLLCAEFEFKDIKKLVFRFLAAGLGGGGLYLLSLPISTHIFKVQLENYKGMNPESMSERLFSVSGIINAIKLTYQSFFHGFWQNFYFYPVIEIIRLAYIFLFGVLAVFLAAIIMKNKINKQPLRLFTLLFMVLLIPLATNLAIFFTEGGARIDMVYAFVLVLVFVIIVSESIISEFYNIIYLVGKQATILCIVFLFIYYIMINNVYYLKAYFFNQRTIALTTRIATTVDPLIPQISSGQIGFFGGVPSEYYPEVRNVFSELRGYSLGNSSFLRIYENNEPGEEWHQWHFIANIGNLQGIHLDPLLDYYERNQIRDAILHMNMPVWPAEGSIAIINDIIIVNFGITDIIAEEIEGVRILRARHWISDAHATTPYEYYWEIFKDNELIDSRITNTSELHIDILSLEVAYGGQVHVTVKNTATGFQYPFSSIDLEMK
jgi:hypothetical protein